MFEQISTIDELVPENDGVIITVPGKEKYVVLSIDEYDILRELEFDAAIQEARSDTASGNLESSSVAAHLRRIE